MEGVNDVGPNAGTLHTTQGESFYLSIHVGVTGLVLCVITGCTMPASGRNMTGCAVVSQNYIRLTYSSMQQYCFAG